MLGKLPMKKRFFLVTEVVLISCAILFSQSKYSVQDTLIDGHSFQVKINKKTGAIHRIYGLKNFAEKNGKINEQNNKELLK